AEELAVREAARDLLPLALAPARRAVLGAVRPRVALDEVLRREGAHALLEEDAVELQVHGKVLARRLPELLEAAHLPVLHGHLPAVRVGVAQALPQELDDAHLVELLQLLAHLVPREPVEPTGGRRAVPGLPHAEVLGLARG